MLVFINSRLKARKSSSSERHKPQTQSLRHQRGRESRHSHRQSQENAQQLPRFINKGLDLIMNSFLLLEINLKSSRFRLTEEAYPPSYVAN